MDPGLDPAIAKAAAALAAARRRRRRLPGLDEHIELDSLLDAYAIQHRLVQSWGGRTAGWKVGCTNPVAQKQLGVDEPFRGQVLAQAVHESPATLAGNDFIMRVIEPEFAFRLARDLPARDAPYDGDGVAAAVGELVPVIEIVDSAYQDWLSVGAPSLIADNGCFGGLVLGRAVSDWQGLDLGSHTVRGFLNGNQVVEGSGANVMGHPLNSLAWLANDLASVGLSLAAGEIVSTGVCSGFFTAEPGDSASADFGELGEVSVAFSAD
jgi:2-oxo-3-hexenedioate decarboxylase/2-keto-4-pentenoate hydratase